MNQQRKFQDTHHSSDSLSQRMIVRRYQPASRRGWNPYQPAMFVAMGVVCFACSLAVQILILS
ncbi:MAG: hypothetical protein ACO4CF_01400 [bacterium]|nr:MAG: hypothetical protein EVA80_03315 [Pseudomonadota bacterium]